MAQMTEINGTLKYGQVLRDLSADCLAKTNYEQTKLDKDDTKTYNINCTAVYSKDKYQQTPYYPVCCHFILLFSMVTQVQPFPK